VVTIAMMLAIVLADDDLVGVRLSTPGWRIWSRAELPRGEPQRWEDNVAEQPDPLSALVGRTRAILLGTLALPMTTTQLAEQLGLSPAAVSQHLKILHNAALVSTRRRGRAVLYQRTQAATALLTAIPSDQASG
jgi:DNA-binding transcriptional ArsR family regulator